MDMTVSEMLRGHGEGVTREGAGCSDDLVGTRTSRNDRPRGARGYGRLN
jgi:hypothetical protein